MNKEIARYRRFTGWNYAKGASLFITIATKPRRTLFGKIVGGKGLAIYWRDTGPQVLASGGTQQA